MLSPTRLTSSIKSGNTIVDLRKKYGQNFELFEQTYAAMQKVKSADSQDQVIFSYIPVKLGDSFEEYLQLRANNERLQKTQVPLTQAPQTQAGPSSQRPAHIQAIIDTKAFTLDNLHLVFSTELRLRLQPCYALYQQSEDVVGQSKIADMLSDADRDHFPLFVQFMDAISADLTRRAEEVTQRLGEAHISDEDLRRGLDGNRYVTTLRDSQSKIGRLSTPLDIRAHSPRGPVASSAQDDDDDFGVDDSPTIKLTDPEGGEIHRRRSGLFKLRSGSTDSSSDK